MLVDSVWSDPEHTALRPICRTCLKPLLSSQHKRRDQIHMIGLSKLPLDHIDMEDLEAWGVFVDLENPLGSRLMEEGTVVQVDVRPGQ